MVSGLGFRVRDSVLIVGFRVSGFESEVLDFGCRASGFGFRVSCPGFRVSGFGCGFQVSGIGHRVPGGRVLISHKLF